MAAVFADAVVPRGGVLSLDSLLAITRAFRIDDPDLRVAITCVAGGIFFPVLRQPHHRRDPLPRGARNPEGPLPRPALGPRRATGWREGGALPAQHCAGLVDHAFVCGPSAMIDDVEGALPTPGLPRERIYVERFTPSEPASPASPADLWPGNSECRSGVRAYSSLADRIGGLRIIPGSRSGAQDPPSPTLRGKAERRMHHPERSAAMDPGIFAYANPGMIFNLVVVPV